MKKRTIITTEKREVWVFRPLSGEIHEVTAQEGADEAAPDENSQIDQLKQVEESDGATGE